MMEIVDAATKPPKRRRISVSFLDFPKMFFPGVTSGYK